MKQNIKMMKSSGELCENNKSIKKIECTMYKSFLSTKQPQNDENGHTDGDEKKKRNRNTIDDRKRTWM